MTMESGARPTSGARDGRGISGIEEALAAGNLESARDRAEALIRCGAYADAPDVETRAALLLGYGDLASSRVKRAYRGAKRCARAFQQLGDVAGEIDALVLRSRAAAVLGRSVDAVESALLATTLAAEAGSGASATRAQLALAVAYAWGGAWLPSARAFEVATRLAEERCDPAARHEVRTEGRWMALLRHEAERRDGAAPDGAAAWRPADEAGADAHAAASASYDATPGILATLAVFDAIVRGLLASRAGDLDSAAAMLALSRSSEGVHPPAGWITAARAWLEAELAMAQGDLDAAALHASHMTLGAVEVEHLPLASLGHRVAARVFAAQGRADLALAEIETGMAAERRMRAQDMDGRSEVAGIQVAIRQGRTQLVDLAARSARFEKEAYEDALTGIANLRRFNECLAAWSCAQSNADTPLCVALIDVDLFRNINNNFSYETGNEALRGIAAEMVAHVRESDLAARWGGDEFVILFRDTPLEVARQVALRIQQAVAERDWAAVAPGLNVGISVGVTEAHAGDDKTALIARSEQEMFAQKMLRRRQAIDRAVPPLVLDRVGGWLRGAQRIVVFVGNALPEDDDADGQAGHLAAWTPRTRIAFGHVDGLASDPVLFHRFWNEWRQSNQAREPTPAHAALVDLARKLPQVLFVTERIDGVLAMCGADNVIELYGNAFQHRCSACARIDPSTDGGRCLACGDRATTIRPDVVLLGEHPDPRLLAGAELAIKRADVVLVLDCDATTFPGAGLLDKAKVRGARIVMLGSGKRARRGLADVVIAAPAEDAAVLLSATLSQPGANATQLAGLSDAGFELYSFLCGQRADNFGVTLEQALRWRNWEIEQHRGTLPWIFPLPTPSRANPETPTPARGDFALLAADEQVRGAVRQAFLLMLRFYGFEWRDDGVVRAEDWRNGFASWAIAATHHDLFISRILGALHLLGLGAEARAFLRVLETEVAQFRRRDAHAPLGHWRMAVAC